MVAILMHMELLQSRTDMYGLSIRCWVIVSNVGWCGDEAMVKFSNIFGYSLM